MQLDPDSPSFKLWSEGMEAEIRHEIAAANRLYRQAWDMAVTDDERFMAAQHLSRHPPGVADKLKWDETALQLAMRIGGKHMKVAYPGLHLNIGRCYEDLANYATAEKHYQLALALAGALPDNKYGQGIRSAIADSLKRVTGRQA